MLNGWLLPVLPTARVDAAGAIDTRSAEAAVKRLPEEANRFPVALFVNPVLSLLTCGVTAPVRG